MKVSVLLPSLFPNLAQRAIDSLRNTGSVPDVDLEIVVCSPQPVEGKEVVWVKDVDLLGNNPAIHQALAASTAGPDDFVYSFSDDAIANPGWLERVLAQYKVLSPRSEDIPFVLSTNHGPVGTCFGRLYANFPFAKRSVVDRFYTDFYPFSAHWGDVSFSMAVWEAKGYVAVTTDLIAQFSNDRMGNTESAHRTSSFLKDTAAFVKRFAHTVGEGWPIDNFRQYNIDLSPDKVDVNRTIDIPSRGEFLAKKLEGQMPLGDWLHGGMWFMPTHQKFERCQATLDAIAACGTVTRGLVLVNGGDQPTRYNDIKLPQGWEVKYFNEDVPVCDMYRWFFRHYPDLNWFGVIPDDVVPEKGGWDVELITTASDRWIASGNDDWQNGQNGRPLRMHGATVYGGELIRAAGFLCIDDINHNYFDDTWETVGRELGIWRIRMDVMTRHDHPWKSGDRTKPGYERTLKWLDDDRKAFNRWQEKKKAASYESIRKLHPQMRRVEANLAGVSIAVATPCYDGNLTHQWAASWTATMCEFVNAKIPFDLYLMPGESLIQRARNAIVKRFMESDFQYLMMIDADMGWDAKDVLRLMSYKKDIIAAAGRRKSDDPTYCCNPIGPPLQVEQTTGLVATKEVGSAFMLVSRSALERMMRVYGPDLTYTDIGTGAKFTNLFDTRLQDGMLWSEDYVFCQRARAIGIDVWTDPTVKLAHIGRRAYAGAFVEVFTQTVETKGVAK